MQPLTKVISLQKVERIALRGQDSPCPIASGRYTLTFPRNDGQLDKEDVIGGFFARDPTFRTAHI
jgi:hypothetical protein